MPGFLNMFLSYIVLFFLFYMVMQFFKGRRKNTSVDRIIDIVRKIDTPQEFFEACQEEMAAANEDITKTKIQVLELWGALQHKRYDMDVHGMLEAIDLESLVKVNHHNNDDSLFYILLAIPNILYRDDKKDLFDALAVKLSPYEDDMKDRLDFALYNACLNFYKEEMDQGVNFFVALLDGNYEGYSYAKQLIGLYKQIAGTMLFAYETKNGQSERFEDYESLKASFEQSNIGQKWVKNLEKEEEKDEEVSTSDGIEVGSSFVDKEEK